MSKFNLPLLEGHYLMTTPNPPKTRNTKENVFFKTKSENRWKSTLVFNPAPRVLNQLVGGYIWALRHFAIDQPLVKAGSYRGWDIILSLISPPAPIIGVKWQKMWRKLDSRKCMPWARVYIQCGPLWKHTTWSYLSKPPRRFAVIITCTADLIQPGMGHDRGL